ncbi:secondary thiamine-phosphate synthase enzyme YjbQ [Methanobacterium aggregans]|uniref:secondary thiamine-phosphate synthase enzyme YjbQ n=1 Tax=Methanobacterium aggregans TaxID=1615586 RepID=UPI001AE4D8EA|nr:secondary thiamine-phosphate synthase enzyme YjbQ [Methanobacterium aggregans]MBP2045035.1 secondary thiamine-phosphate synthase enzyme [Methanobacterium aggregans]
MPKREVLDVETHERVEVVDITRPVKDAAQRSGIKNGLVSVFTRHSTSGVVINENESGLVEDFKDTINSLIPKGDYKHNRIDNNADSHIKAFLIGSSETIPLTDGSMGLGTWQSIFFVELDGPRQRKVDVTVLGE